MVAIDNLGDFILANMVIAEATQPQYTFDMDVRDGCLSYPNVYQSRYSWNSTFVLWIRMCHTTENKNLVSD